MSHRIKSCSSNQAHRNAAQGFLTSEPYGAFPGSPANLRDLESTLRSIIEPMVLQRLDGIFERVRHLEAANDNRFSDSALVCRLPAVLKLLGISKSTLYAWLNPKSPFHSPSLPQPFKLGDHAHSPVVWRIVELEAWIESRRLLSRNAGSERSFLGAGA